MRCNHFLRRYTTSEDGTSGNEHVHFRNYRKPVLIVQQWIPLCYGGGGEGGNEGEDEKEVHGITVSPQSSATNAPAAAQSSTIESHLLNHMQGVAGAYHKFKHCLSWVPILQVGGLGGVSVNCFPKEIATCHGRETNPQPRGQESDALTT
ncbi:hypothetical protein ElyMa_004601000 [Elysia marginata]|uniref:Uncharacterized protein n=1 Tax=Elysia marginata TaxID=1093978 RepID=A0AAV4HZM9_9GAST|nr:hypothetical protein ElyMa_004601000 [Elysia marginata]